MNKTLLTAAVAAALLAGPAFAGSVYLVADINTFDTEARDQADNEVFYENVFGGQNVVNYSEVSISFTTATETALGPGATVTSAALSGADFAIFGFERTSVSAGEISALSTFTAGGGNLFIIGENDRFFSDFNDLLNTVLSGIGSSMRVLDSDFDDGGLLGPTHENIGSFTATGPETAGVTSWATALAANIDAGSGTALISGVGDLGAFGTAVAKENLHVAPIPVPGGLILIATALGGLRLMRGRRTA